MRHAFPGGALAVVVLLAAGACSGTDGPNDPSASAAPAPSATSADVTVVTHDQVLEERVVALPGQLRLGDDVLPPTNRWYSSLAFGQGSLPVYPRPLSMTPRPGGFGVGQCHHLCGAR